ncbi:hypothetical protein XELAEV_18015159mg [Xenopus laevis]|uniref:Uncharacterized protein n=1 Tax=Xenopus laevis TaxID=8355 RepID=A0A974HVN7_XENLA|nr:hypothetical protein XELAEV_18015159mg [Xenopus laevis]
MKLSHSQCSTNTEYRFYLKYRWVDVSHLTSLLEKAGIPSHSVWHFLRKHLVFVCASFVSDSLLVKAKTGCWDGNAPIYKCLCPDGSKF